MDSGILVTRAPSGNELLWWTGNLQARLTTQCEKMLRKKRLTKGKRKLEKGICIYMTVEYYINIILKRTTISQRGDLLGWTLLGQNEP